jgi:hypothetical protein
VVSARYGATIAAEAAAAAAMEEVVVAVPVAGMRMAITDAGIGAVSITITNATGICNSTHGSMRRSKVQKKPV